MVAGYRQHLLVPLQQLLVAGPAQGHVGYCPVEVLEGCALQIEPPKQLEVHRDSQSFIENTIFEVRVFRDETCRVVQGRHIVPDQPRKIGVSFLNTIKLR